MARGLEIGLVSFGDVASGLDGGRRSQAQVIRDVIEEAVLADRIGVDFIGLGEHHRPDFAISSPETVLAAIAARTTRIILGSAVTVLGTDDPVRVFQRFATLGAISQGRAEIIVGRGAFPESFPLFGFDMRQYGELFDDKLDLLAALIANNPVSWSGWSRPPLTDRWIFPEVEGAPPRLWAAVGGNPDSVMRAARYNLPLMIAISGGDPVRFKEHIDLYHGYNKQLGRPVLKVGICSPGYVAETDEQARREYYDHYKAMSDKLSAEFGRPVLSATDFDYEVDNGSLYVGCPETVALKIGRAVSALQVDRFALRYSTGSLSHIRLRRCIELYGGSVAPQVREMLSGS